MPQEILLERKSRCDGRCDEMMLGSRYVKLALTMTQKEKLRTWRFDTKKAKKFRKAKTFFSVVKWRAWPGGSVMTLTCC